MQEIFNRIFLKQPQKEDNGIYFFGGKSDGDRFDEEDFSVWQNGRFYKNYKNLPLDAERDSLSASLSAFYFLRNERIHTVFMGLSAAVAVKDFFFTCMKKPVMVVSEQLSGSPELAQGFVPCTVWGTDDKRFFHKHIKDVQPARDSMGFHVFADFFPVWLINKMQHAAGKNDVVFLFKLIIQNVSFEQIYLYMVMFGQLFCLFYSRFRNIKCCDKVAFPSPQPMSRSRYGLTGGRSFIIS